MVFSRLGVKSFRTRTLRSFRLFKMGFLDELISNIETGKEASIFLGRNSDRSVAVKFRQLEFVILFRSTSLAFYEPAQHSPAREKHPRGCFATSRESAGMVPNPAWWLSLSKPTSPHQASSQGCYAIPRRGIPTPAGRCAGVLREHTPLGAYESSTARKESVMATLAPAASAEFR
jgi:hypothetical protein